MNIFTKIKDSVVGVALSFLPNIKPYQDYFFVEKDGRLTPNFDINSIEWEIDILKTGCSDKEFYDMISLYMDKFGNDHKLKLAGIYLQDSSFDRLEKTLELYYGEEE